MKKLSISNGIFETSTANCGSSKFGSSKLEPKLATQIAPNASISHSEAVELPLERFSSAEFENQPIEWMIYF